MPPEDDAPVGLKDTLDAAGAAAGGRIADAPIADDAEGAGGVPLRPAPAPQSEQVPATPQTPADPGDMRYRDAAALRQELETDRERWRPFEEALGTLDDASRARVLAAAPNLGADLALVTDAFAALQPTDRQYLAQLAQLMQSDPAAAAQGFADAAEQLRAVGDKAGATAPTVDDEMSDLDAPITRADLIQWQSEREAETALAHEYATITSEAKSLGYDPESQDPVERARFDLLVLNAQRQPDGSLAKAHDVVESMLQARVDEAMNGKRADARRPQPPGGGAPPSQERRLEDDPNPMKAAEGSMRDRINAALGLSETRRR